MRDDRIDPSIEDLESVIRAAGGYVRASEDLRPRVLESARSQQLQKRSRRRLRQAAVVILFLGVFTSAVRHTLEGAVWTTMSSLPVFSVPETVSHRSGSSWEMVESFTELRRRHAEALSRL